MDGIYSRLNRRVRQLFSSGYVVIDRTDLGKEIDYSEMSRESLEDRCRTLDSSIVLYQNGYRSVVRGKGIYVNYEQINNEKVLERLIDNAGDSADQKTAKKFALKKVLADLKASRSDGEDFSQMAFGFGDNNEPILFDEMSREELINWLERVIQSEKVNAV